EALLRCRCRDRIACVDIGDAAGDRQPRRAGQQPCGRREHFATQALRRPERTVAPPLQPLRKRLRLRGRKSVEIAPDAELLDGHATSRCLSRMLTAHLHDRLAWGLILTATLAVASTAPSDPAPR